MKIAISVLLMSVVCSVYADARIESRDNFCHVPRNEANVDDESFVAGCDGDLSVTGNRVKGESIVTRIRHGYMFPEDMLPGEDTPGGVKSTIVIGQNTGTNCVMVDTNNTEYQGGSWVAEHRIERTKKAGEFLVTYRLSCFGGIAQ